MIVATAGHVDHGKTALVRALTGVDTDRLAEEKRRGLTIELGFACRRLPSGRTIGFIDVPGHERFLRTMVAGVGGVDLALLAVAADEGVKPQTVDHVAVLSLLGVTRVLVALTRSDRADAAVRGEADGAARALLAGAGIEPCVVVPTAAPDGTGIGALVDALAREARRCPPPSAEGGFRLAVDRAFVVRGAGVVVTGTVHAGEARVGERLKVMPSGRDVRVRAIHAWGRPEEAARQGERAALNLSPASLDDVGRGDWVVAPGILTPSWRFDAELVPLAGEARPFAQATPVHVHHGAARVTARAFLLDRPRIEQGGRGLAQLVLDGPLVPAFGDRFVLRDIAAQRILGGGRVLDPAGPARGRARPRRLAELRAGDRAGVREALSAVLEEAVDGVDAAAFLRARNLTPAAGANDLPATATRGYGRGAGRRVILSRHWDALETRLLDAVEDDHARRRDRLGPLATELRRGFRDRANGALVDAALRDLCDSGRLVRRGAVVHRPGRRIEPGASDREFWARCRTALGAGPGSPPALFPLADRLGSDPGELERFLERMAGFGLVVRIARNRYLTPGQIDGAAADARRLSQSRPEGFTAAMYRDAAGVGRNFVIDLLEYLDRRDITVRKGDLRTCPD